MSTTSRKKHIIYLGSSGFPYGLAEIQKIRLISKCLVMEGNTVTVICKRGPHDRSRYPDLKAEGNFEGINYIYTSGTPFRHPKFLTRNFLKLKGMVNQLVVLRKLKKEKKIDFAILSTHNFYAVLYYFFLSKIFGFKTILNYVEFYSGVKKKRNEFWKWLNDELFDKQGLKLVDSVFLISEFLIGHLKKTVPGKKYLKIPNLTDVRRFDGIEIREGEKYFLFCGDAGYFEIIQFIIDAYDELNTTSASLYLVINGSEANMQQVRDYVQNSVHKDKIKLSSRLTDLELNTYYKNAIALLIPLRPTFQDSARFPHKIGEYLASGNPVISTNYGEVKYYFKDMEDMLVADSYDIKLFAEKMQFIIDNPEEAKKIGEKGKLIAVNKFDFRTMAVVINNFLDNEM